MRISRIKPFTGLTFAHFAKHSSLVSDWFFQRSGEIVSDTPQRAAKLPDLIQYDTFLPNQDHSGVWNWLRHCRSVLMPEGWSHQHSCSWQFKSWLETTFYFHSCRVNFQPEQRTLWLPESTQTKSLYLAERSRRRKSPFFLTGKSNIT